MGGGGEVEGCGRGGEGVGGVDGGAGDGGGVRVGRVRG